MVLVYGFSIYIYIQRNAPWLKCLRAICLPFFLYLCFFFFFLIFGLCCFLDFFFILLRHNMCIVYSVQKCTCILHFWLECYGVYFRVNFLNSCFALIARTDKTFDSLTFYSHLTKLVYVLVIYCWKIC